MKQKAPARHGHIDLSREDVAGSISEQRPTLITREGQLVEVASFVVTAKTLLVPRVDHALTVMTNSTGSKLPVAPSAK